MFTLTGYSHHHSLLSHTHITTSSHPSFRELVQKSTDTYKDASFYDNAMGFIHAVSWEKELWLQGLLAFHVLLVILIILTRRFHNFQVFLFIVLCGMVWMAETLNKYAGTIRLFRVRNSSCSTHAHSNFWHSHPHTGQRWRDFSTQNYFDKRGVFTSVVFSLPLLLIVFFQMVGLVQRRREQRVKWSH